jgi:seryl-tRNA synthetase
MKRIRISLVFCLVFALSFVPTVRSQSATTKGDNSPAVTGTNNKISITGPVVVQSSAAEDELISVAKAETADKAALDSKLQTARGELDSVTKTLSDEIQATGKTLNDEIKADKKYKPLLDKIADLQTKLKDAQTKVQTEFQSSAGVLQQKVSTEDAQVQALTKVVKKDSGLPDSATFDVATQKWTVPDKK